MLENGSNMKEAQGNHVPSLVPEHGSYIIELGSFPS